MTSAGGIRVGLIGAGFMGAKHARLISGRQDMSLVAVADPRGDAAARFAGAAGHTDHRAMLDAGGIDAAVIANPNHLHVDTAIDCLDAGVPVLVEKPVATSYRQARRLADAVAASGTPLLVGHHRRHHPAIAAAREIIASGGLGRLVAVSGMFANRKHDAYFDEEWHRSAGGGVMLINLIHDLDLLRHLIGEVATVQATTSSAVRGLEVEDTAAVNLGFAGGAVGSFLVTDAGASPWGWDQATDDVADFPYVRDSVAYFVTGTAGALSIPDLATWGYHGDGEGEWRRAMSRTFAPAGPGDSYTRQLAHFADVVRGTAEPLVSAADAAESLALIDAAVRAAREGTTVRVAELTDDPASASDGAVS